MNSMLCIVMYHRVLNIKNGRYPRLKGLEISEFRAQMEFFRDNYSIVTMDQVLDVAESKEFWRLPGNPLLQSHNTRPVDMAEW